ncbi:MAG: hypothetical protein A07HN63_02030 [uncultured archaeon A07HN63]|nr:MAG: hypothetical protein A07HN63_02030 [uncultured archaeon A07HN63]
MGVYTVQLATCGVGRPMNSHGALTLSLTEGSQTFQVVDYASADIRETLTCLDKGETVRVGLTRISSRGDAWKVVEVKETPPRASTDEALLRIEG